MATSLLPSPPAAIDPALRRFTRDEYYQLLDAGLFQEQRVELIDGVIVQMAAQKNLHAAGVTLTADAIRAAFGAGYWVRVQSSLDISPHSVPDPDIAVVKGSPKHCAASNPTSALLVVEVSDSTLRYDSNEKASLYACSGIADYWIVNLVDRWLEIRRDPIPDPSQHFGFAYLNVTCLQPHEFASPLASPGMRLLVDDLLP
jgi:Uma2 family endonuclease